MSILICEILKDFVTLTLPVYWKILKKVTANSKQVINHCLHVEQNS